MKTLAGIIGSLLVSFILLSFGLRTDETFSLTIKADNLRNSNGIVQFALYNKDGSIPDENFKRYYKLLKAKIINNSSTATFHDLPVGKYAVNVFHDENNNGKIDTGFILPVEGIGFSNYQTLGLSNRPSFSKASLIFDEDTTIKIRMNYL